MTSIYKIFENLGYKHNPEAGNIAININVQYFTNKDGSIRWIWPVTLSQPLFLKFYNIHGWKTHVFEFIVKKLFAIELNHWFFKTINISLIPDEAGSIFDITNSTWALFTGTTGPNQKYIIYQEDDNKNGIFTKIPISDRSATLIDQEKMVLTQLANHHIKSFVFPKIIERSKTKLTLSSFENYDQRCQTLTQQHTAVFEELEMISSETFSFEDLRDKHHIRERLMRLENTRNKIPSGIIKKLQRLHQSLLGSQVATHIAHKDFTPWNMYTDSTGKLYIYDWELSRALTPKGFDFFHFIIQKGILSERKTWAQIKWEILVHSTESYLKHENIAHLLSLYLLTNVLYYLELYNNQEKWHQQINWLLEIWNEAMSDVLGSRDNSRELLLIDIFDWLSKKRYAGLKLPAIPIETLSIYSDLDLLMDKALASDLVCFIKTHPLVSQIKTQRSFSKTVATIITKNDEILSIDCIHSLKRKNIEYMSVDEMIDQSYLDSEGNRRVNDLHTSEFVALFYGLNYAVVPKKFRFYPFEKHLGNSFLEPLVNPKERGVFRHDPLMRIMKKEKRNQGFSYLKNTLIYYFETIMKLFSQRGMIISFSGVDGAGKSTVIQHTKNEIEKKLRRKVVVIRHRPSLLPILSAWSKGKKRAEQDAANSLPRQGQNRNILSSLFRFTYYYFDYIFGQFYIYLRHVLGGTIVLYDRYYFDFINDSLRSNIILPKWFLKNAYRFLLQPDLNYFLYADPKTILSRKKELDESSIETLTEDYLQLFGELEKKNRCQYHAIENVDLDRTLTTITEQIQTKLF
jgi:thymidylate kinase